MGHDHGTEIYPLDVPDSSVDVIRASHVLEHFSQLNTVAVLQNWVSKLKPGGLMRVAVPNFEWIARKYLDGEPINVQGYTMGGQTDADDFHAAIFDEECLAEALRLAGLIDISRWDSDCDDCSSLEVSLNLQGIKPHKVASETPFRMSAVMSVPRLGFMDNFFCAFEALEPMGIPLRRYQGAYWEACMDRVITDSLALDNPDGILTLDYDTVFKQGDVECLKKIMIERPEVDALAPLQGARNETGTPLLTFDLPLGVKSYTQLPHGVFADDITRLKTAHFGLTVLRSSALRKLPRPWMQSQPAPDGTWGEGRCDADISFWRNWELAGLSLYSANRVVVGHLELMIRWPAHDLAPIFQLPKEFREKGAPAEAWK
jgi:hypothetical protein